MKETPNVSKLIKPIVAENGQTKLDFKSSEKLLDVLKDLNDKYPLIRDIIKDRISSDGEYFYINKVKMTQDDLILKMKILNKYEIDKKNKEELFDELFNIKIKTAKDDEKLEGKAKKEELDRLYKNDTNEQRRTAHLYGQD